MAVHRPADVLQDQQAGHSRHPPPPGYPEDVSTTGQVQADRPSEVGDSFAMVAAQAAPET